MAWGRGAGLNVKKVKGIHHISAIVGDINENIKFYQDILGLRLVKQTLNFDDSAVYHLYFSNEQVNPGFLLTFFPWQHATHGRKGGGQIGRIAFRVPKGYLKEWEHYLFAKGIETTRSQLFGQDTLEFSDPHSLDLAIVETDVEHETRAIYDFHGVAILSENPTATKSLLTNDLGLLKVGPHLFKTDSPLAQHIIVNESPLPKGRWGTGTVHHLAWSVPSQTELLAWQDYFFEQQFAITEVKDRKYFKSIYLQEKGNVIFEFATVDPGLEVDESFDKLGQTLQIPPHFEIDRDNILAQIKPITARINKYSSSNRQLLSKKEAIDGTSI